MGREKKKKKGAYSLVDVAKVCVEDGDQAFVYEGPEEKSINLVYCQVFMNTEYTLYTA